MDDDSEDDEHDEDSEYESEDEEEEAEKAPLSEEEELEQFIDSIQPKKKNNPSDIIPREKTLTDDEAVYILCKGSGNEGTADQCTLRCADGSS